MPKRHVVMFSAGGGSWKTARRVAERHGKENLTLLFTDTLYESPDTYRFLIEGAADVFDVALPRAAVPDLADFPDFKDRPAYKTFLTELRLQTEPLLPGLKWIADGRDIWDVFRDERFLGNSGVDPCSKILKRQLADRWMKKNLDPKESVIYVGIDWTEKHRFDDGNGRGVRPRREADGWTYEAPLTEPPYIWKPDMIAEMRQRGLTPPVAYEQGFSHNNCLSGDTRFITAQGAKTLREMAGQTCKVLTSNGAMVEAEISSFGVQPLVRLHLRRYGIAKTIDCTLDHRWFAFNGPRGNSRKELLTRELTPGTRLVPMFGQGINTHVQISAFGIAHGIVFGDGTRNDAEKSGYTNPASVVLCGDKDAQLAKWFPLSPITPTEHGLRVNNLPRSFKDRPSLKETKGYLAGWLAGLLAADGSVSEDGAICLHSASYDNLMFVRDVCYRLGIGTNPVSSSLRKGFGEPSEIHKLTFLRHTMREDMFLIEEHRNRAVAAGFERQKEDACWTVERIEDLGISEEVFCATVPEYAAFTLEDNILTGNCHKFCIKAGHEHYENLLRRDRDTYLYYEQEEQDLREFLNADVSILTDRAGDNKKKVMTLRMFRERIESSRQLGFVFDEEFSVREGEGGCGCMLEAEDDDWTRALDERLAELVATMGQADNALKAIADELGLTPEKVAKRMRDLGIAAGAQAPDEDWGVDDARVAAAE